MSDKYEWCIRVKYNPSQPRVPAGSSEGGQWTSGGGAPGSLMGGSEPPMREQMGLTPGGHGSAFSEGPLDEDRPSTGLYDEEAYEYIKLNARIPHDKVRVVDIDRPNERIELKMTGSRRWVDYWEGAKIIEANSATPTGRGGITREDAYKWIQLHVRFPHGKGKILDWDESQQKVEIQESGGKRRWVSYWNGAGWIESMGEAD